MLLENAVETERLLLRPENETDCDHIYRINTDPQVMRYIGDGSIMSLTRDELCIRLKKLIAERVNDEYGIAAVVLKETNKYIGACWLKYDSFVDGVELGYRYAKDAWGKGYATEAAMGVLKEGFKLPKLTKVFARAHHENLASLRVIEKLGFKQIDSKYDSQTKTEVPVFQLLKDHYFKNK